MKTRLALAAVLCLLIAPQWGCKWMARKITEKAIERSSGANDVQLDEQGGIRATTSEGDVQIGGATLPAGWPAYLPTYKDARVLGTTSDGKAMTGIFEVQATPEALMAFYEEKLKASGFSDKQTAAFGPTRTLTMKKGKSAVHVAVLGGNDARINVTMQVTNP